MVKKELIKIDSKDLRLTILGCFRYSLGRKSYMPNHISNIIKEYKDIFERHHWQTIISDIDDCSNLGMDCDKKTWKELKEFAKERIK